MSGVRVPVSGEDKLSSVLKSLEKNTLSLDKALAQLARQERNNKIMKEAEARFKAMSDAEKQAAISADDLARAQDQVARESKEAADSSKGFRNSMTELKSTLDVAREGLEVVAGAIRTVYSTAKEGAALDYASGKFDRLAQSIGTTSDKLLFDLRRATSGMMSDAEIWAQAGDIMGLGLAKTNDQLVRLVTVSSGLGMDMNQLVLALTNQTTARFDQLNVSVDGFDQRLKKLKDTGMNANDAFTEAFLQQAEKQLEKIGSKAETDAGKIARMEAAWSDFGNSFKTMVAPPIADVAESLANILDMENQVRERMDKFEGGKRENPRARKYRELQLAEYENSDSANAYAARNEALARAYEETQKVTFATQELAYADEFASDQGRTFAAIVESHKEALRRAAEQSKEYESQLKNLQTAQENYRSAVESFGESFGNNVVNKLEQAGIKGADLEKALGVVDDKLGTSFLAQKQANDELDALIENYKKTGDIEAFDKALDNSQGSFESLDKNLQKAKDSFDDAKATWEEFIRSIGAANNMHVTITADVITNYGSGAGAPAGTGTGGGRGRHGGESEGAAGLDIVVPPGHPYDDYTIGVSSGEHVTVERPGSPSANGTSGNNVTIVNNNYFSNELSGEAFVNKLAGQVAAKLGGRG